VAATGYPDGQACQICSGDVALEDELVSARVLAAWLDCSRSYVTELEDRGVLKRVGGKLPLRASVSAYVRVLRQQRDQDQSPRSEAAAEHHRLTTTASSRIFFCRTSGLKGLPFSIPRNRSCARIRRSRSKGTRQMIVTEQGRPDLSSRKEDLVKNTDGSVDVYFGPEAPKGKEANWVQTVPGKGWFTYFRFYGPTEPFFDKSWALPDFEKEAVGSRALR